MIAYKFVIKRNNKYYPLLNYGIDGFTSIRNCPRYEFGKIYNTPKDFHTYLNELGAGKGYHFFKISNPRGYNKLGDRGNIFIKDKFEEFLNRRTQNIKITCIKCEIMDIVAETELRVVAKKFQILQEVI